MANKRKKDPRSYLVRQYRQITDSEDLKSWQVKVRETDLHIMARVDVTKEATDLVIQARNKLENYIARHNAFIDALHPLADDPSAPALVREMLKAGLAAEVGPMASVAGVIAEYVGRGLLELKKCDEVVVENGGDIFLHRVKDCITGIFAGESPLSYQIGIKIPADLMPVGICTSSGTIGHSLSLGKADSVTVVAPSTTLADASATRLANMVKAAKDIGNTLEQAAKIVGLRGVVIVVDDELGAWGNIELVDTSKTFS